MGTYATLAEIRAEGVTTVQAGDARLNTLLETASRQIDIWCRRWFESRSLVLKVDGSGTKRLQLRVPIISISEVAFLDTDDTVLTTLETTDYKVYNRHLARSADVEDQHNPKIELVSAVSAYPRWLSIFPKGSQNIKLTGKFGYTEYDGSTADGITPPLIKRACLLLVLRDVPRMADPTRRRVHQRWHFVTSETVKGQTYQMRSPEVGNYSGDYEIDRIIEQYKYDPIMGGV